MPLQAIVAFWTFTGVTMGIFAVFHDSTPMAILGLGCIINSFPRRNG